MPVLAAALVVVAGGLAVVLPAFAADVAAERLLARRFARAVRHDELEVMLRTWLAGRTSSR